MALGRIRRWFTFLVLGAFLFAGLGHPMPNAEAASMADTHSMHMGMHMGGEDHAPMPCKAPLPNCDSLVGCIFMVALAPVFTPTTVHLAWSRVRFMNVVSLPMGIALQPDLGPPILV